MHRNYTKERSEMGKLAANLNSYRRIFNTHLNIGFFFPKKDQCDLCGGYQNATEESNRSMENKYVEHQEEKELSRAEKDADNSKSKEEGSNMVFAIYDLQAALLVPMGQSSAFCYKSSINCINFAVTYITNHNCIVSMFFLARGPWT